MAKMRKTSLEVCEKCEYYYGQTFAQPICGYYYYTRKHKKSPIGYCKDEFEPRVTDQHKVEITLFPREGDDFYGQKGLR